MADRNTPRKDGIEIGLPVAASTKIEAGHLVAVTAAGYAVPAGDTAGYVAMGVAQETVDNSAGVAGDLTVLIRRKNAFKLVNSSTAALAQANVGGIAYVEDSVSLTTTAGATNDVVVGIVIAVESDGVWVDID